MQHEPQWARNLRAADKARSDERNPPKEGHDVDDDTHAGLDHGGGARPRGVVPRRRDHRRRPGSLVAGLAGPCIGHPVLLIGISLVVAGTTQLRQDASAFAGARWLPLAILALGIYVFFPLTPAIAGSFTAGRLGVGGWMLLFAVFGYGLTQLEEVRPSDVRRP